MATNPSSKESTTTTTRSADTAEGDTKKRETPSEGYTITIPSLRSMGASATTATEVVEPKHLAWFGALVVAGAAGVIEWPVVAAVGIGSIVTERFARSGNRSPQSKA
jgi:hypothetical protein